MKGLIEYFVSRSIFVNLLSFLILGMGAFIAFTMNREAFPNVDFDIVIVTTVYPGASPPEVEKLVTTPIEESIQEVDGIEEYTSSSLENRSGVIIKIDPDVDDTQKVIDDIRSAVDRTEDLPEDAEQPILQEMSTDRSPVIEVALGRAKGPDGNYILTDRELRDQAEILEDRLLDLPGVARIQKNGWRDAEIHVNLNPQKLQQNYIGIEQVINAINRRNVNLPGGDIVNGNFEKVIRTMGEFVNTSEIANLFIRSNEVGRGIRVSDVGFVREELEEREYINRVEGYPAVSLVVVKRKSADIITLVEDVKKTVDDYRAGVSEKSRAGVHVEYANDISYYIKRRLGVLQSNGIVGLILVVGSLFFFMGWRTSFMVALGIPLSVGITFIFMQYLGVTLNLISMFALILVIGIIVDDAIIVSENFYRYYEEGYSTYEAAVKGTTEVVAPVLATISTSIAAFGPLMFMTGIFGKFIYTIPLVIIIALLASLFESFFILPSHLYDMNKYSAKRGEIKGEGNWFVRFRERYYKPLLNFSLNHRYLVMIGITIALFIAIFFQAMFGKFVLFPAAIETLHVKMEGPRGSTLDYMEKYVEAIEKSVAKLPESELDTYTSRVGIIQQNANDPNTLRGGQYAQLLIYLTPESDRSPMRGIAGAIWGGISSAIHSVTGVQLRTGGRGAELIVDQLRLETSWLLNEQAKKRLIDQQGMDPSLIEKEIQSSQIAQKNPELNGGLLSLDFEKMRGGPPVGKPVSIEITGTDYETLNQIADQYKTIMEGIDGIIDIDDDYEMGKDEIRLSVIESLAARAGVSVSQAAIAINAAFNGAIASSIKGVDEEVDIRVQFAEPYRDDPAYLGYVQVVNQMGRLIPVGKMVEKSEQTGVLAMNHKDGERLIKVTANLQEEKLTPLKAANEIEKRARGLKISERYPGYSVKFGGENEDTQESFASLGRAFLVGFVIIFMILASLFRSLIQPAVVMGAIPFSFIGVILAFMLNGVLFEGEPIPLSFMSMLGIIGLSGVVVNDSIILVDFANNILRGDSSVSAHDAVMEAGLLRLRAVMLTTITTVLGLLPTAYGLGGDDPFLRPMALAFGWGLLFSTILTLIVVPVQYMIVMDLVAGIKRVLKLEEH